MRDAERNLWERYHAGDQQALEDLLIHYTGLVRYWANELARIAPRADRDDLIQEGLIVLVKVIKKFDLNRGYEFSTYAGKWVREALLDYLQKANNLTDYQYRQCRRVDKALDILMRKLDRMPTVAEIAEEAKLTERQVEKTLNAMAIVQAEQWNDDDSHLAMSSATVDNPETNVLMNESLLKLNESLLKLNELLPKLKEKERWILNEYYYLDRTDKQIAEQRGLKPDTVKMIRNRALKKLAKLMDRGGGQHED